MNMTPKLEHGLVLFLVLMFLIPCGLIVFISGEVPYRLVPGEPVKDAAQAAGITITSVKDTTWNLTGATGGKVYVLTDSSGNVVTMSTQAFNSAESRDAAILLYNAHPVGKGKPVGSLLVVGQYLVYVTPANSGILETIAPELKKTTGP
ncbi:MAG: hypothetical protein M0R30_06335 [Methanoregula sp.]|uniref:hypothetical protein n=1 Tax=Methanoregula sp. TaxID=2052170 RepID=UPI0025CF32B3|nr:hypothetical protein [Methanoregula sp.]MCK9631245.1 hypothetical protein [Methanoregula sp.]